MKEEFKGVYRKSEDSAEKSARRKLTLIALTFAAVCIAILLMSAPHVGAQGCAMCYQNAAASGVKGQAALRHGILILLVPAVGIFGSILAVTLRRL